MIPRLTCLQCGAKAADQVLLSANRGAKARLWNVQVCRDCWRALEAMLDSAVAYRQHALDEVHRTTTAYNWFW